MAPSLSKSLSELPELLGYRTVLANLIARDLKVKYQSKGLGFLWSLVQPAILIGIWYLVFHTVARFDMPRYWAYLLSGMLTYQFMQGAIVEGAWAVRRNAGIIRKVYVPMEILIIAAISVRFIEYVLQISLAVLLLALLHHGAAKVIVPFVPQESFVEFSMYKTLVVLPGALLLVYLFVLGVSMPLAGWSVIYRDLDHVLTLVLTALFYLTPVFWSLRMIEHKPWLGVFALNPFTNLLELFHGPLYWGTWPQNIAVGGGAIGAWGAAIAMSLTVFVGGWMLLGQIKHTLAEVV